MPDLGVGQVKKAPTPPLNDRGLFVPFEKDGKRITEILRFNAVEVFFAGFIPPLVGSVSAILIALVFHNDAISNYNWQCGRARLPSLSRIINLSVERTFWQLFLLFHVPIRVIELITGFSRYKRLRNIHCKRTLLFELARLTYFYIGLGELVFLSALSIVGERENIQLHVIFFYLFGFCGIAHMIGNIYCHAHSLYYINPYGRISYYLKITFAGLYLLSAPILVGAFLLYWKQCITWAYDVFAICEYCGVFLNICFHGCAFFDIRYKVCFSVRHTEPIKDTANELPMKNSKISPEIEMKKPRTQQG
uniref:7TM_GPCR_Srx domain-containing protein n=1 Tax=Haemonchus contortus TaxID=6289 RepID=A0A7I4YJA1_HAECO|nr:Frag1 DRAM Sfk1 domain containing protein [Haemonchus contortus]